MVASGSSAARQKYDSGVWPSIVPNRSRLGSARVLAAAVSASSDPARKPETSSEEADHAMAAVVYGSLVDGSLHNVDRLLRSRGGGRGFIDNLLLGHGVGRLLIDRRGRGVADLGLVSLGVRVVVGHVIRCLKVVRVQGSGRRRSTASTNRVEADFSKNANA